MAAVIGVLVGTSKGLFVLRGDRHGPWDVAGPFLRGQQVDAVAWDGSARVLAGGYSEHWGPSVVWSDDLGATFHEQDAGALRFPDDTGVAVQRVWQIVPAGDGVVWAGVEPAALFRSGDGGRTFALVRGLWEHPHRPLWEPGGGGLCLHTIVPDRTDAERMWVAISTGGVYRTEDGGVSWRPRNQGIATTFLPGDEPPEFGQCVHKMAADPVVADRLYLQHHWGVYRSDDAGDSWVDIGSALPSDFGFPLVVQPGAVFVLPLDSDEYRATPDARCRAYRSTDAGDSWTALTDGLPQQDAHLTVLRDAMTTCADPAAVLFGTRTGEVYASLDGGDSWTTLAEHLPPVLTVRATALA